MTEKVIKKFNINGLTVPIDESKITKLELDLKKDILDILPIKEEIIIKSGERLSVPVYLGNNRKNITVQINIKLGGSGPTSAIIYTDGTNISLGYIPFNYPHIIDSLDYDMILLFAQTFTEDTIIEYIITFDNVSQKVDNLVENVHFLEYDIENMKKYISVEDEVEKKDNINFFSNQYFNTIAMNIPTPAVLDGVSSMKIECKSGDSFLIYAVASKSLAVQLYSFWRSDTTKIEASNILEITDYTKKGLKVIAPEGAAYMTVNMNQYATKNGRVFKFFSVTNEEVIQTVNNNKSPLMGRTIVCFGDSITEHSDIYGKKYSDYITEYTGANVINVGVGGARLEKRKELSLTPDDQSTAFAALDVISIINPAVDQNFEYQDAAISSGVLPTGGDMYIPIIERLKSIDFNNVDIVTVFAGTNSWRTARALGSSGQKSESFTLGAINLIIDRLLTKYPHIKLYWFTPMVRWIDDGGFTESTWSDNYTLNGYIPDNQSFSLKQYKEMIKNEVIKNHIPICDMYDELGINMYNFWNYFSNTNQGDDITDGTHPLKGMNVIAKKIISFITSNLLF